MISVACAKGCRDFIEVSDDDLSFAMKSGAPISVAHEVCPKDRVYRPEYRVAISVHRQAFDQNGDPDGPEVHLNTVGGKVHAATFKEAFGGLSNTLSDRWSDMQQWAEVMEQDLDTADDGV